MASAQQSRDEAARPARPAAGRIGRRRDRRAGEQTAADRDRVQRDVGELADARRQEPLERLVADAGDQRRERRRDDRRRVRPVAPHPQEQPGDDAELDEVDALDGPDRRIGAAGRGGVGPRDRERRRQRAVAERPVRPDARQRHADRGEHGEGEAALDQPAECARGTRHGARTGRCRSPARRGSARSTRRSRSTAPAPAAARRQRTAGSVDGSPVLRHFGWPNPPLLTPLPPAGLSVMSNTMLSGRVASPLTPPTPARKSRFNAAARARRCCGRRTTCRR